MNRIRRVFFLFLLITAVPVFGTDETDQEELKTIREERGDILRYGIDSEVISLITDLIDEKEDEFCDLVREQASRAANPELVTAAFRLFSAVDYGEAQELAIGLLEDYDLQSGPVLSAALSYLEKHMSDRGAEAIVPLLKSEQTAIARSAVHALGMSGRVEYAETLMELLEDDEYPDEVKTGLLVALGDLKALSALDLLTDILQDDSEEKAWRWYACQSLGKIGEAESFPVLRSLMGDSDPTLRTYAAEALGGYDTRESEEALIDALRDSYWKVRVSACRELGERESKDAVPALIYKARNDPETNVKKEAITALGRIGEARGLETLRDLAGKKTTNPAIWAQTVQVLVEEDLKDSFPVLEKMLADEWQEENSYFFNTIAKLLSDREGNFLESTFEKFLDHPSIVIKIYGIRGAEKNRFTRLKERITKLSEEGNARAVRQAALSALENL